jgi:hypothetical protein
MLRFTLSLYSDPITFYKYTQKGFQQVTQDAGFEIRSSWSDDQNLFGVYYLETPGDGSQGHGGRP